MEFQALNKQFGPIKSYPFLSFTATSTAIFRISQSELDHKLSLSDPLGTPIANYDHRFGPKDELLELVIDGLLARRLVC
jgi:hypothetical protein